MSIVHFALDRPVVSLPEPPAAVDPGGEGGHVVVGHAEGVGDAHAALAVHLRAGVHLGHGGGEVTLNQINSGFQSDGKK